jgi:hypothetical protein
VTFRKTAYDRTQLNLALEVSIDIGLAILLSTACLLILRPFIPLLAWGIVISIAVLPKRTMLASENASGAGVAFKTGVTRLGKDCRRPAQNPG